MKNIGQFPNGRTKLKKLSKLRAIAESILNGPRSVFFADDPNEVPWLEPVVHMKTWRSAPKTFVSLVVFSVPNCLERSPTSPLILRYSIWDAASDKSLIDCNSDKDWPAASVAFFVVPANEVLEIDNLLRQLDESLLSFPFAAEGLDLEGASGFNPLPIEADNTTFAGHFELCRRTRFYRIEVQWTSGSESSSLLEKTWQALFDKLIIVSAMNKRIAMNEKYDMEPSAYAHLLMNVKD